jgi:hypothetical protein
LSSDQGTSAIDLMNSDLVAHGQNARTRYSCNCWSIGS